MTRLYLTTDAPRFFSDICEVIRVFWPQAEISMEATDAQAETIAHTHARENGVDTERWSFRGREISRSGIVGRGAIDETRRNKRLVKTSLFLLLRELTGIAPSWGALTGIRPTRLLYEAMARGMDERAAQAWLREEFFVSGERVKLLSDILDMQRGLIDCPDDMFDLYIGIPFCVTRCAYCSFSSGEIGSGKLVEPYIAALLREIEGAAQMTRAMGLRVRAAYMGGGTPTSLSADQLDRVLAGAIRAFPNAREWTVEAGRPDTIDREKLRVLREHGIARISVNPQTFCDDTLVRIGRAHTSEDTLRAYELAREMGFRDINMDIIAALPEETTADFARTLARVRACAPESVTVHTLAIKRSSKLHERGYRQVDADVARAMVDMARETLEGDGYRPYYLYRQKYMAGNLENVGYAKQGCACLYNIGNMEETARVLALGAGAITKWLFPRELRIERACNVKNIEAYIDRVEEMLARKRALLREEKTCEE